MDGEIYQWVVSYQKLTSQKKILISQGQCTLSHVVSDHSMSTITPRLVRSLIHKGLERGWNPKEIGRGFSLQASESLYKPVKQERAQAESGACNIPDQGELLCEVPSFYASDREWPFRSIPFEVAHFRLCGDVNDHMIGAFFAHMAASATSQIKVGKEMRISS